jgi:5,5'-dehydrodivanillate O-demethylase
MAELLKEERSAAPGGIRITYNDLLRTGPGTVAGRYLRSYWQPVHRSEDLPPGAARPIRVMSEDFTLYRGEDGVPHLLAARCSHRGARLALGTVEGSAIQCPYHGWTFDGSGACIAQPAEPRPFCERAGIAAYPTRDYLGLVFAYLGEGEPPPFETTPEFEDEEHVRYSTGDVWPCNYFAQMENTLDVTHTTFLHWQFRYKTPDQVAVEETPYGLKVFTPGLSGIKASYDTHYLHMPNVEEYMAAPKPGEKTGYFARSWRVPRDDESFIWLDIRVYPVRGADAAALRARRAEQAAAAPRRSIPELALAIVRGEVRLADLKDQNEISGSDLIQLQDCAVMASLSPMASREHKERLGQMDLGIAAARRLWTRELRDFAAGRPPRAWERPARLWEEAYA